MDFSSDIKEQVRSQTDIVALIGEAVALTPQRGGREHVGLCCFHDDHNPSMRVYADRQSYRCWVCNAGGDCFSFVQEREKVSFPEALEILAKRTTAAAHRSTRPCCGLRSCFTRRSCTMHRLSPLATISLAAACRTR